MIKYTIKRLLSIIPMLACVILLVFFLINLMPGDPGRTILGLSASQEAVDEMNEQLGYNKPILTRLGSYLKQVFLHFDFGTSYTSGKPVINEIMLNFRYTLRLTVLCTLVQMALAVPLGILAAVKQYSAYDNIIRVLAILMSSMPSFWISMCAILLFALVLGILPSHGVDTWKGYILPVGINFLLSGSALIRMTRTIMLETIRQDYVRTARAKGCREWTINLKYAFANAALPIITSIGLSFGSMLGGMVIYESVFSMPGLGTLAMGAVNAKDVPTVMGTTIFFAVIFSVIVVLVDLIGAWLDPRVRAKYTKG